MLSTSDAINDTRRTSGFMIYFNQFHYIMQIMTIKEKGMLFDALFQYFDEGKDPEPFENKNIQAEYERLKLSITKDQQRIIETARRRSEAGKKRWKKTKEDDSEENSPAGKTITITKNKNKNIIISKTNSGDSPESDGESIDINEEKTGYGEYHNILLSSNELESLKKDYPNDWARLIEDLSTGIAAKGYHYDNYLAGLRFWAEKKGINRIGKPKLPEPMPKITPSVFDIMRDPEHPGQYIPTPEFIERKEKEIAKWKETHNTETEYF